MARKSYQPIGLEQEVKRLVIEQRSPSQIYEYLSGQERFADRMPSLRTIQRLVKEMEPPDPTEEWRLADTEPEDARLVLDVLAAVTVKTRGRARLTRATAEWVIRVRRAAPTLDPFEAYLYAREYRAREERRGDTRDLDLYLALAPWDSEDARRDYEALLNEGITTSSQWFTMFRQVWKKNEEAADNAEAR